MKNQDNHGNSEDFDAAGCIPPTGALVVIVIVAIAALGHFAFHWF